MKIKVIKIGGEILSNEKTLNRTLKSISKINSPKLLVHGGGKSASSLAKRLGIETQFENGRRITSKPMLDVATMVYGGLINKQIVAKLQGLNCNSIGISGADLNMIKANIRKIQEIDFGYVGDIETVNVQQLLILLENGITPVVCALTHNGKGQLLNTNADTIASSLAIELSCHYSTELMMCFGHKGVLEDVNNEDSLVEVLSSSRFKSMRASGKIHTGMLPKLENGFRALRAGVSSVIISDIEVLTDKNNPKTRLEYDN